MKTVSFLFIAFMIISIHSCKKDSSDTEKVKANFGVIGFDKRVPVDISFINSSANATSFLWSFGDGTTSTNPNPIHNYTAIGTYFMKLKVTGPNGVDSICKQMTLSDIPDPSKTDISYFMDKCEGTPVNVIFHTLNPQSIFPAWDFGDGVTSLEKSPIIRFSGPGTYLIKHSTQINGRRDTVTLGLTLF